MPTAKTTNHKPAKAADQADVTINVPLPGELHRQLKIRAATDGINLKDGVIAAIEAWVAS